MRKSVKVVKTMATISSDLLCQRLLASAMRDEAPLLEVFSRELFGVAPSLFHDNDKMRKNNNAELMK